MNKLFKTTNPVMPGRSLFDLSYSKLFTADMGKIYPVLHEEMVPGDKFSIANEMVVRCLPLVVPILHQIDIFVHYFFVPYRLLWSDWEAFISGGIDGRDTSVLPRWDPTSHNGVGTLWDYFGFPIDVVPTDALPLQFPLNAYNLIWNEYYMDETIQTKVALDHYDIKYRCWEKDYFTSCLPFMLRGDAPAFPISGTADVNLAHDIVIDGLSGPEAVVVSNVASTPGLSTADSGLDSEANLSDTLNSAFTVDLSSATSFTVADVRLAVQVQRWMERNARCGVRYTEFLHSHFGVSPRDERLQRPEYVGGSKAQLIVSEILQTSATTDLTTPQGNMAGHGISVTQTFCGKYFASEYGIIMGLLTIMPKPMYMQGINRQWLRRSKFDFYFPEFMHLSEQAVESAELVAHNLDVEHPSNRVIFGYQGRYDEMRFKSNLVCGEMRTTFSTWHLARTFESAPTLTPEFLICEPDTRIFAVPSEPGFIIHFGNIIKAIRPLPITGSPGLMDHI